MEPFQMILFLFHMFHMCFLVSTVITMTCWSMNPCYDVIITSIPGTSQQYGDGDALEILEFHIWAKYDPNQARPAVTRCDHDGVSCGLFLRSSTAQDVWPFCQIKHPCHWIKRLQTLLLLGKAIVRRLFPFFGGSLSSLLFFQESHKACHHLFERARQNTWTPHPLLDHAIDTLVQKYTAQQQVHTQRHMNVLVQALRNLT